MDNIESVILQGGKEYFESDKKAGVFINLYYEDTLDRYYSYIDAIPLQVDVFITTSNDKTFQILQVHQFERSVEIIKGLNRGRDIAALLVTFEPYIKQYDYFCFIHDKACKNEEERFYTDQFIECLWENLLGSQKDIYRILNMFDSDEKLGLILPPMHIGEYAKTRFSNDWGNNYENVRMLAQDIGIDIALIDERKIPVSLGTAFWARRENLTKLLSHKWNYEDFKEEPLPDDGELNHAIERIFQYVTLDMKYKVCVVYTIEYAIKHINYLESFSSELGGFLHDKYGVRDLHQLRTLDKRMKALEVFCMGKKDVYIYGAGVYGKECLKALKALYIEPKAFVVSDKSIDIVEGIPVFELSEIKDIGENDAFIIAIKDFNTSLEIERKLREAGGCCVYKYI